MVAIKGHFDGKVIVPDEPLRLVPNQKLLVTVQVVKDRQTDFAKWIGVGSQTAVNPVPRFKSDDDLWG